MIKIDYPQPAFRIQKEKEKEYIFDTLRKKWVILTPEEWVRQNFVQYLVQVMHYPASLIAVEKEIKLGELKKRFDILVYDKEHRPWMMIECKAAAVKMEDSVLQQVLRYHITVPVQFIIITNGHYTVAWKKNENDFLLIQALPSL